MKRLDSLDQQPEILLAVLKNYPDFDDPKVEKKVQKNAIKNYELGLNKNQSDIYINIEPDALVMNSMLAK